MFTFVDEDYNAFMTFPNWVVGLPKVDGSDK